MVVAQLSVPSCMDVQLAQLELLKNNGDFDNYEISSDNTLVTLYWTYLKKDEIKNVSISRVVTYKGRICQERANRAWLYYDDENVSVTE
jgi:hypothetical protein